MKSATCCLNVFKSNQPSLIDIRRSFIHVVLASISSSRPIPLLLSNLDKGGFRLEIRRNSGGKREFYVDLNIHLF